MYTFGYLLSVTLQFVREIQSAVIITSVVVWCICGMPVVTGHDCVDNLCVVLFVVGRRHYIIHPPTGSVIEKMSRCVKVITTA